MYAIQEHLANTSLATTLEAEDADLHDASTSGSESIDSDMDLDKPCEPAVKEQSLQQPKPKPKPKPKTARDDRPPLHTIPRDDLWKRAAHIELDGDSVVTDNGSSAPNKLGKIYYCREPGGTDVLTMKCVCWKHGTPNDPCFIWIRCNGDRDLATRCVLNWQSLYNDYPGGRHRDEAKYLEAQYRAITKPKIRGSLS